MASIDTKTKLSKRTIDAAEPRAARYELWDADLSGFGLRIETSGRKTFLIRYRTDGGGRKATRRSMVVGQYGKFTPEEARKKARQLLGSVANGDDPAAGRTAKRREMTIAELLLDYDKRGCVVQRGKRQGIAMKPLTKAYTMARLNHHVLPLLGKRRISDVRSSDIVRFVADVAAGKTASDGKNENGTRVIVRGGEGAARKVVRDLSAVFTFAQRSEIVSDNPCEHAAVNKTDNQRKGFLTLDQVKMLGAALAKLETIGVNVKATNIARLWALTGCRRNEIAGLRWSEIDFERAALIFGDSKTGFSMRPLNSAAMALLAALPRDDGCPYVFPAERGEGFYQGTKRVWPEAIKLAALPGVTPHTLRHTLGSTSVSSGETLEMTGALLGHANMRSTQVYAHLQADPSLRVANRVGRTIGDALLGKSTRPSRKARP
ncbi:tyrosine-type recombinase/integrase [Bosea sp. PAMC 26642]|uniref:tyrosine-type recombinase/integrase n=1 Tax=Bosea sp. (strain PAMC 26642) TaxID=1792307 RepID=UPI0007700B83|nr:integrase arm-type DNA-binding domain-containing protein [Bosea sp. PAMC 26642]AMJ61967.1 integrase [Bosea sp. PAMC 26642]